MIRRCAWDEHKFRSGPRAPYRQLSSKTQADGAGQQRKHESTRRRQPGSQVIWLSVAAAAASTVPAPSQAATPADRDQWR